MQMWNSWTSRPRSRAAHYTQLNQFLTAYMAKDNRRIECATKRIALDVRIGIVRATVYLLTIAENELHLSITSGQLLLAGSDHPVKTTRIDLEIREGTSPGLLFAKFCDGSYNSALSS